MDKQVQLWIEEDKKYPWKDAPPKVKVIIANQQIKPKNLRVFALR